VIFGLLALHALAFVAIVVAGDRLGRTAFLLAALPPAAAGAWAASRFGAGGEVAATAGVGWVGGLDLRFAFAVDRFALLLTLVVGVIGTAVFVYAAGYFAGPRPGLARLAATLLAFGGSMLGLVWADSIWTLFVFWEATSITSFLLVGHDTTSAVARLAARRALLVTVGGGLALLGGLVILGDLTGTDRLGAMRGALEAGPAATVAAVLVLVGAATKSAQVPFHIWLPGAMAAPTPVSAYLHSATMVKAGVILVALAGPVFDDVAVWEPLGAGIGIASLLVGGWGALRHVDAKLVLAYGTVSQLGLLITLLAVGETFAALALLSAHAVFKASLFMVVGEVDVRTGTRDLRQLSGLWRTMPGACAVALVSGASMIGAGPVLGFAAKESAIEAVLDLDGAGGALVAAAVVVGSVLTAAYTVRLLAALFRPARAGGERVEVAPGRAALAGPSVLLSAFTVGSFALLGPVSDAVAAAAAVLDPQAASARLYRWHGVTPALLTSVGIVVVGTVVGLAAARRLHAAVPPSGRGAQWADLAVDSVLVVARRSTGRVQHGSLPLYLATMALVAALATLPFAGALDSARWYRWDSPAQAVAAGLVLASALGAALVGSRLGAALALGGVGFSVTALFVVQGAPDLALTQLLVETIVVVGFVLGLGGLRRRFPPTGRLWRGARLAVAGSAAAAVTLGLLASSSNPVASAPRAELAARGVEDGGGNNLVNVVLTDVRALDTLGEVLVLSVVALGVLALARAGRERRRAAEEVAAR